MNRATPRVTRGSESCGAWWCRPTSPWAFKAKLRPRGNQNMFLCWLFFCLAVLCVGEANTCLQLFLLFEVLWGGGFP